VKQYEDPTSNVQIDLRLKDVVERMFQRCYDDGEFKQVFILTKFFFFPKLF
jgi:26S proteasome regulatory subunit N2